MVKTFIRGVFELRWDLPEGEESHNIFAILKKKFPEFINECDRFFIEYFHKDYRTEEEKDE